jgi:hypothetical protein
MIALIENHIPKASTKSGRPHYPLAMMLHIHLLHEECSLSERAMEVTLTKDPPSVA